LVVGVEKTAAAELGIAIDAVVADKYGIVVAVVTFAVVETAQLSGSAGLARGQKPVGGNVSRPMMILC
jgi:hypothetical protein